jgi:hypothetical protein
MSIIRRIETASPDFSSATEATLGDEEIELMVIAIFQNQDASSLCLGCLLPDRFSITSLLRVWRNATPSSRLRSPTRTNS